MKFIKYLSFSFILLHGSSVLGQEQELVSKEKQFPKHQLTIEPAIGMNPAPTSDLVVSNLLQWNMTRRYSYNNAFHRNFNYITNNYNYSHGQKLGIGISFSGKHLSQTFSLQAGIKYDAFKETLNNPEFVKVVVSIASFSPDYGFMYNLKFGEKKYFFSYRMYIPLYPYPIKSKDYTTIDGNMANFSLELGVGIHLK
jgi:hypothetical protein